MQPVPARLKFLFLKAKIRIAELLLYYLTINNTSFNI